VSEPRILIVDDDPGVRQTFRMVLGKRYHYREAESPYQAEQRLREETPDLVLLDLNLRGGSGLEVLPILRRHAPGTAVIIITACGTYEATLEAFSHGADDFLEKDFRPSELRQRIQRVLERRSALRTAGGASAEPSEPRPMDLGFFSTLARVMESQDYVTAGHSLRVSRYATAVGRRMGLDDDLIHDLELAGFMHDLGKVGVNKSVLNKEGRFTRLDRVEVERHPVLGEEIIKPLGYPLRILRGVRHHHERLDGSGYPDRIDGRELGIIPRIIAVVDSFDAMTWQRLYRPIPIAPLRALELLATEAPDRYDPDVVDALSREIEAGGIDIQSDPIRAHAREQEPPPTPEAPGDAVSSPGPEGESMDQASRDLLASPFVRRARFAPLPTLYANPEQPDAPVVQLLADQSGPHAFLDPEADGEPAHRPLRGRHWRRLWELIAAHQLRPFYPIPGTITVNPALHLPLSGQVLDDAWIELTDGEHIYVATMSRPGPGLPLAYALQPGRVEARPGSPRLDRRGIEGAAPQDAACMAALTWMRTPEGADELSRLQGWLDQLVDTEAFERPIPGSSSGGQDPRRTTVPLSPDQVEDLATWLPHRDRSPLLALLRGRSQGDHRGLIEITWSFGLEERTRAMSLWDRASGLRLRTIPLFQAEIDAALLELDQLGVETLGQALTTPRPAATLGKLTHSLQTAARHLLPAGEIYTAAALQEASARLLRAALARGEAREAIAVLEETTIGDLSLTTDPARSLLERMPAGLPFDTTIAAMAERARQEDPAGFPQLMEDLRCCCEANFDARGALAVRLGELEPMRDRLALHLHERRSDAVTTSLLTQGPAPAWTRNADLATRAALLEGIEALIKAHPSAPRSSVMESAEQLRTKLGRSWTTHVRFDLCRSPVDRVITKVVATVLPSSQASETAEGGAIGVPTASVTIYDRLASISAQRPSMRKAAKWPKTGPGTEKRPVRRSADSTFDGHKTLSLPIDDAGAVLELRWKVAPVFDMRSTPTLTTVHADGRTYFNIGPHAVHTVMYELSEA
jgi:putative two-component system response regulator